MVLLATTGETLEAGQLLLSLHSAPGTVDGGRVGWRGLTHVHHASLSMTEVSTAADGDTSSPAGSQSCKSVGHGPGALSVGPARCTGEPPPGTPEWTWLDGPASPH